VPAEDPDQAPQRAQRFSAWRAVPIGLMLIGTIAFFALDLQRYLSFEELSRRRDALLAWRDDHQALAVLVFVSLYALAVAVSVPGAIWFTIIGGFLFGVVAGTAYAVVAATLGACAVFLAARYLVGDILRAKAGPGIRKMEAGFREHALSYLLVLRLIPIVPFWLVNLVPAFVGVPLRTFFVGTALGIIPGTLVYTCVGNGLGVVIDQGGTPDLGIIFEPEILAPILGLALLALSPVLYRRLKQRRSAADEQREQT
jgi:uncharacterized membrane protein YdjX (TVP38/TMEM64 family)